MSSADGTMLTVSWTAPADNGGSAITGYKVMYKMTGSDEDYRSMNADADATSVTIENLSPNTSYSIAVVAVNAAGDSAMGYGLRHDQRHRARHAYRRGARMPTT